MSAPVNYHIYPCGDHAVTIQFGDRITLSANQQVVALFQHLQAQPLFGVRDLIPAYNSLTLVYDIFTIKHQYPDVSVYEQVSGELHRVIDRITEKEETTHRLIRIPVCYDVSFGMDLASLAALHQLSIEEVIALHNSKTYRVYMIGFMPGFAYMGTVDAKIITPRHPSPRKSVAAGSVGIAGEQTGIYPFTSPGGWQIIGRTPVRLFSPDQANPCLLQPGDEVQFYPIDLSTFQNLNPV
ncbi:MAG: 5-oxoprolinase subunit PxpB [Bacteroidota bacterium]|nr:5-oxoprolinase subunit PxpB [Bacteroidota bacterium]